jgi:hypothetical protein
VSPDHEEINAREGARGVLHFETFVTGVSAHVPVLVNFQVDEALTPILCQKQKAHVWTPPTQAVAPAENHVVEAGRHPLFTQLMRHELQKIALRAQHPAALGAPLAVPKRCVVPQLHLPTGGTPPP